MDGVVASDRMLKQVATYNWAAANISEQPAGVKSMCGKSWTGFNSDFVPC